MQKDSSGKRDGGTAKKKKRGKRSEQGGHCERGYRSDPDAKRISSLISRFFSCTHSTTYNIVTILRCMLGS